MSEVSSSFFCEAEDLESCPHGRWEVNDEAILGFLGFGCGLGLRVECLELELVLKRKLELEWRKSKCARAYQLDGV